MAGPDCAIAAAPIDIHNKTNNNFFMVSTLNMILLIIILHPHLAFRLSHRMLDTLRLRYMAIGLRHPTRVSNLSVIPNGLAYPCMCHIMTYHFLRRMLRPDIRPQIRHCLFLGLRAGGWICLRHHNGAY